MKRQCLSSRNMHPWHSTMRKKSCIWKQMHWVSVLSASPLQVRHRVWFPKNGAPESKTPWPISYASNSLTSAEQWYRNIERESLCLLQLAHESIYWINMNAEIEDTIRNWPLCLDFQAASPKDMTLSHEIQGRLWESVVADIF